MVKQSQFRLIQARRVPGGGGSQILKQSAHEGGNVVSRTYSPLLTSGKFQVLISARGLVDLRAIVRPEVLCQ